MFRTTVSCLGLLAWGSGCSEWPRFSHRPADGSKPYDQIAVSGSLVEAADPGWPDHAKGLLLPLESPDFGEPFFAVDIHGTANPVAHLAGGSAPFADPVADCPNLAENPPVDGSYQGDLDFVRFAYAHAANADEYGLCLVLTTNLPQPDAAWDLVAYEYSESEGCTVGDFLTQPATGEAAQYAAYTEVGGHNYIEPGHPDLALYIAGSVNTTSYTGNNPVPIDYDVFVYPVRDPVGCEILDPEFFQSGTP